MTSILSKEEIVRLLMKYGIILIAFDIFSRFGLNYGLQFYYSMFPVEDMTRAQSSYTSLVVNLIGVLMNLIISFIVLFDMDRKLKLTWLIFVMALFSPWTSVLFLIVWRIVEMKDSSQQ